MNDHSIIFDFFKLFTYLQIHAIVFLNQDGIFYHASKVGLCFHYTFGLEQWNVKSTFLTIFPFTESLKQGIHNTVCSPQFIQEISFFLQVLNAKIMPATQHHTGRLDFETADINVKNIHWPHKKKTF